MMYHVKWKQNLQELIDILLEEGFNLQVESPQSFSIEKENEGRFEVFSDILSFFVGYSALRKHTETELLKKGLRAEEVVQLTENMIFDSKASNYFFVLTNILVKEYLKSMETFNLDSFMLFNMKDLKKELKNLIDYSYAVYMEKSEEDREQFYDVNDLFAILNTRLFENGINVQEFNEIHVSQQGEYLTFKNKQDVLIDQEFFEEYMGSSLDFDIPQNTESPEVLEGLMTCSAIVQIFDVTKLVLHTGITDKAKDLLKCNLTAMKKETGKRIKVVDCNGCNHCK